MLTSRYIYLLSTGEQYEWHLLQVTENAGSASEQNGVTESDASSAGRQRRTARMSAGGGQYSVYRSVMAMCLSLVKSSQVAVNKNKWQSCEFCKHVKK